ncbi:MAG: hypothetical protein KJ558_07270 [Gammaproteobacteria bacterium]|nr:hypothetical protein [Gammaproteobacteria bacterium]MBU1654617.1 hypothetical protein [Gammaproteobacteria bacterium]MBU1959947.1 hypothetical protein [Gammaproteobacteria bacterium]
MPELRWIQSRADFTVADAVPISVFGQIWPFPGCKYLLIQLIEGGVPGCDGNRFWSMI